MAIPPGLTVIPDWMFYTGLGIMLLTAILLCIIIFLSLKTPVFTWLKAIFSKSPLFLMSGRDNVGGFFSSKKLASEWAEIKKQGLFSISEGSFIFDRKSKLPIYLAHQEIGATINKEWPGILEQLRSEGFEIRDSKDYKKVVEDKANKDILLKLSTGKTIKISDLQQYFPLNIKPTFIKSIVENEKRKARKQMDNLKIFAVIGFATLLVSIGGYLLIDKVGKVQTECRCDCGYQPPETGGIEALNQSKPLFPELQEPTKEGEPAGGIT